MEDKKPVSMKTVYITCGVFVTSSMIIIKFVATAINKVVAVLLEVN